MSLVHSLLRYVTLRYVTLQGSHQSGNHGKVREIELNLKKGKKIIEILEIKKMEKNVNGLHFLVEIS